MIKLLLFLIGFALLAGCTAGVPQNAWCYEFNFTSSNYGFTIVKGNWTIGGGFTPDDVGDFNIYYIHTEPVTPSAIKIVARRADAMQLPVDVTVRAVVFGIDSGLIQTTVPQDTAEAELWMVPGNGAGSSDNLLFFGHVSRTVQLLSMQVRGDGSNPFAASNCSTDAIEGPVGPITVPINDWLGSVGSADDLLTGVDVPITAPDGSPLLPNETGAAIYGYVKWITSPAAAGELMGPFAPVYSHVGIFLTMDVALIAVYVVVFAAVYIIRWIIWLFKTLLAIIQTIASAANGVIGWLLSFIGL